jgi:aspartyl-tRNA(Asn)/glutamyl-tRNA(Gln) amidotransferase subunit B
MSAIPRAGASAMRAAESFEAVIGLEIHAQILTRSKMFCGCSTDYLTAPPNANTCPVCLGLPGSLPVINREAVRATIKTALALNCEVAEFTKFDRKNYFYPDLPKGYQISQYDLPLSRRGFLEFEVDGSARRCGITRVHLEEDTGKLLHAGAIHEAQSSLVNFNRSGVPLMEIVSEPDLRGAEEAREYAMRLRAILQYIGVNQGDMESGQLRCDANVSLRRRGAEAYGTKVEIKNMNSFRSIQRAIEYEIERQAAVLEGGGRLVQETRGWNDARGITVSQRTKEYAEDYRYFPEPDLPPLEVSRAMVDEIRADLPELPAARRARFMRDYGLSGYDSSLLTSSRPKADFFEETVRLGAPAKAAANLLLGPVNRELNVDQIEIDQSKLTPKHVMRIVALQAEGNISSTTAAQVVVAAFKTGVDPDQEIERRGLRQVSGDEDLKRWIEEALADPASARSIADYRGGKEQALGFLVGHVMKRSSGRANPQRVSAMLRQALRP